MTASYDWVEEMLLEEGAAFAPPSPELRAGVASRLARPQAEQGWRRVALVAAALALAATLAVEPARTSVAEFFGLIEGYEIEIVETPSTPVPRATALPTAAGTAASVTQTPMPTAQPTTAPTLIETIAEPATAAEAESFLGVPISFLDGRGTPEIFIMTEFGASFVILRYDGLDLWQTAETLVYFSKVGPPGTVIETPVIDGSGAYWVEGPRTIRFSADDDATSLQVTRNSLIWRTADRVYRIETELTLAEALSIAEALR